MIKKAFLNNVYLQRIHDEYILDMYTKKVCKQQNIFVKPIKQYTVTFNNKKWSIIFDNRKMEKNTRKCMHYKCVTKCNKDL